MNTSKERSDKLFSMKESCGCKNIQLSNANEKLYKLDNQCKNELTIDDKKVIKIIIDQFLSSKSENPVQNKVIKEALDLKQDKIPDLDLIIKGAQLGITSIQQETDPTIPDYIKNITEEDINRWNSGVAPSPSVPVEVDPIFSSSPASTITTNDINNWNSKQDVITDLDEIREGVQLNNNFNYRLNSLQEIVNSKVNNNELADVAFTGDYNDLINKPSNNEFEQVNADWDSTSGPSQILNKPSFKTIGGNSIIGTGNISFKTVGGKSIIGTGNIPIEGGSGNSTVIEEVTIMGKGSLASAIDKVSQVGSDTLFQWILKEPQEDGSYVYKMIWHIGDGIFMDALGYMLTSN